MWATTQVQFRPHPVPKTTGRPPPDKGCFPIICAQVRRRQQPSSSFEAEDMGGLGHALQSNSTAKSPKKRQQEQQRTRSVSKREEEQADGKGRQLSGSDVLLALQRVSLQKSKRKSRRKGIKNGKDCAGAMGDEAGRNAAADADFAEVRPLCINSNWSIRLEDLEKRLQEFVHPSDFS
ncbi:hypothetical protein Ancab_036733 [Ancistrocladus abbreviatus]